jgi:hypothetical protein
VRGLQRLLSLLIDSDVYQGQHQAGDLVFQGAVRKQSRKKPSTIARGDFVLDRHQTFKDALGVRFQQDR